MKTLGLGISVACALLFVSNVSAKTVEVTIVGTASSSGTLTLATCVNADACGTYADGTATGICDCADSYSPGSIDTGADIAAAFAAAINADAGCQSISISASAGANVLTITGPGVWYLYLRATETTNCGGLGSSWLRLDGCVINNVPNGTNCDETGPPGGSGGFTLSGVEVPDPSFCHVNCPGGDHHTTGVGTGDHSPDLNSDGVVNVQDFSIFGALFPSPPKPFDPCADYNCDGVVNLQDFGIWGPHWQDGPGPLGFCIP